MGLKVQQNLIHYLLARLDNYYTDLHVKRLYSLHFLGLDFSL
jgi:hypothetical protein